MVSWGPAKGRFLRVKTTIFSSGNKKQSGSNVCGHGKQMYTNDDEEYKSYMVLPMSLHEGYEMQQQKMLVAKQSKFSIMMEIKNDNDKIEIFKRIQFM